MSVESVTPSSISDPAASPAALAVGAACVTGNVEPFSSRGPTIDQRVKPDIVGPDAVSSSVYGPTSGCGGGFLGTSASSPHVAGAAALALQGNPGLQVAEVQQLLEDWAVDMGAAGKDSDTGSGRLQLLAQPTARPPIPRPFSPASPVRLFDSGGTRPNTSNLNFVANQVAATHVTATVGADRRVRLFNATGATHVIVDVAGWYGPTGPAGPAVARFIPRAAPARAFDSRAGLGYAETAGDRTTRLGAGEDVAIRVAGLGGVPATATGVIMNVTVADPIANGFLTVYPTGQARPLASNLNWAPGQVVANLVVGGVGTNGSVQVFSSVGQTHVIVDVIGWFEPNAGAGYVALDPPVRDLDTRFGNGPRLGALGNGQVHELQVGGNYGVPTDGQRAGGHHDQLRIGDAVSGAAGTGSRREGRDGPVAGHERRCPGLPPGVPDPAGRQLVGNPCGRLRRVGAGRGPRLVLRRVRADLPADAGWARLLAGHDVGDRRPVLLPATGTAHQRRQLR